MELLVQTPHGKANAYAYTGGKAFDARLPCIVFIHGALHDHSVWTLLARWFAHHGHAVLAVDQPGHARSTGAPLPNVEALAQWVLALLDAAGVERAAMVGHSMGSLVALEAVAQAAQRVSHLVMVATAYPMKVSDALLTTARDSPFKAIDMVTAFSHSTLGPKPAYPGPGAWVPGGFRALMRRVHSAQHGVNLFHHDFTLCDRYAGGLQAAAKVRCPVTLILGERDQMTTPRQTRDIAQALKARVVKVPAGHDLMAEAPEEVLGALREVLV
ncbi:MAG: alpha/beta hydrolase [Burkholderiaceae bacterium]